MRARIEGWEALSHRDIGKEEAPYFDPPTAQGLECRPRGGAWFIVGWSEKGRNWRWSVFDYRCSCHRKFSNAVIL